MSSFIQLFTSGLDDWAHLVDHFFQVMNLELSKNKRAPSSGSTSTAPEPTTPFPLLLPPPNDSTNVDEPDTSEPSASQSTVSIQNPHGRLGVLSELTLERTSTWDPEVMFDNEVKMLARCIHREATQLFPTVCINMELAAWMFNNLIEVILT